MPMGKGTYGSQVGRPKKSMLTKKQDTSCCFEEKDYESQAEEWLT